MDDFVPSRLRLKPGEVRITYFHHYRVEVCCQVIDLIVEEINGRFTVANTELLLGMSCLSPNNCFEAFDHFKLLSLAKLYPSDFSAVDLVILEDQLQTYAYDVKNNKDFSILRDIGSLAKKMVQSGKDRVFPLVYRLICLALTLPVATATVERVFSAMNIIKTDLRNRMGNPFLNDCLVCYVEKNIFKTLADEDILHYFQNMKPRRMQLPPIKR